MKLALILVFLVSFTTSSRGQISPAWDPSVYLPQPGNPGFDTVHVNGSQGDLNTVYNLGATHDSTYGRLVLTGLPSNPPFLSMIETGPTFDLQNLHTTRDLHFNFPGTVVRIAHIHTSISQDVIVEVTMGYYKIYWEDSLGGYDSNLFTTFGWYSRNRGNDFATNLYVSPLTSDSVCDVIVMNFSFFDIDHDTLAIALYRGGSSLFQQGLVALQDSVLLLHVPGDNLYTFELERNFSQGDWRGVGRADVIGEADASVNTSAWFYYRNDKPFSLAAFANAMRYDTVFLPRENRHAFYSGLVGMSFQALPKAAGDHSEDFLTSMSTSDPNMDGSVYILRGGPDFGSKHFIMDSAAVIIRNPRYYDGLLQNMRFWGPGFQNFGDMTGTGRPVLMISGGIGSEGYNFFYVLGDAADDKADIFFHNTYNFWSDTLTADNDRREDVIMANAQTSTLSVLHGSSRIPIRINPKLQSVQTSGPIARLDFYPNPCFDKLRITTNSSYSERANLVLRNVLGEELMRKTVDLKERESTIQVQLPSVATGEYVLSLESEHFHSNGMVGIIH